AWAARCSRSSCAPASSRPRCARSATTSGTGRGPARRPVPTTDARATHAGGRATARRDLDGSGLVGHPRAVSLDPAYAVGVVAVGVGAGALSGMLGVGGAVLTTPG